VPKASPHATQRARAKPPRAIRVQLTVETRHVVGQGRSLQRQRVGIGEAAVALELDGALKLRVAGDGVDEERGGIGCA